MGLNCGIVGLPNVGKSTIFSALTSAPAEAANYPFCTIEPNVGIVNVPDPRLDKIVSLIPPAKVVPAVTEFVDIAGLVAGASKGEGLGNKFLANIREVGVIAHVVRCFDDPDIIHVNNRIDPAGDIETIDIELALADYETVDRRYQKDSKLAKVNHSKDLLAMIPIYERLLKGLGDGQGARTIITDPEERELVRDLHLITMKPVIYVCNIDEASIGTDNEYVKTVRQIASERGSSVVVICGKTEAEIASLDTAEERAEFLEAAGLEESGMNVLIREAYATLGLRTFFTAGPDEDRAWTFKAGSKAPQAAGVIHTDFEKGFIKAEVYSCEDLFKYGSEAKVKEAGKLRVEGKEYVVQDGDVMFFRFNV
ncbi:MAG: redox-regulated ATPase YchF [Spirochaetales bacterium]|jgi:GTP-binding protein YchF|nr:redox-regulated ATPase YchF [Spirochaetales bacterium]MBQ3317512.1 redox-regulated ATPase YchF [Spirochaetales bacterium]MBQ3696882.1 redox-regulated ATPase YchF [Spirochaetales bacterium]MBQ3729257.1 redox-regulated ATPase YchF [Spirochaetales bacterium]MBQ3831021.1 redox-regulated ATPase YchF [Spirochaetales bacterium]